MNRRTNQKFSWKAYTVCIEVDREVTEKSKPNI